MDPQQERLLELYYGLLSEQEAAELRERIASDPQWAQAWAQTQQIAARVGEAARWKTDRVELPRLEQLESAALGSGPPAEESAHPTLLSESVRPGRRSSSSARVPLKSALPRQSDRWALGVVYGGSALLLLAALWGAMLHRHHLLTLTGEHLRLVVQGPSVLWAGVENHFLVLTRRLDGAGIESQVELALFGPDQKRFFSQKESTDAQGELRVVLPADMDLPSWVELKVTAEAGARQQSRSVRLEVVPAEYQTFLGLDRLYYRRGEKVLFRSLSTPRFQRSGKEEMWVEVEVRDAEDHRVEGLYQEGRTWQGIGCGEFRIPDHMPSGLYTVVARNAQRRFPEVRKPFWVLPGPDERFQVVVKFQKPPYRAGQMVDADIQIWENDRPAPDQPVELRAEMPEGLFHRQLLRTDAQGRVSISFSLPERFSEPEAWLWVKLPDRQPPVMLCKPIPLDCPKIHCQFYPEGGLLVAGVENRVYFSVRDDQGRPVEIRSVLLDKDGRELLKVSTSHLGRGVFHLTPREGHSYRLRIDHPEAMRQEVELPPVATEGRLLVKTGLAVVGPEEPLQFHLLVPPTVHTQMPLVAAVMCRGVLSAWQWMVPHLPQEGQPAETPVQIPLPPEVWGLLWVRIYDYSQTPPVLAAERLFYRLPPQRVQAELTLPQKTFQPADSVLLRHTTKGKQGASIAAVSGLVVVEEKFLGSMPALGPISPYWFLDELWEIPQDLEEMDSLLSDRPEGRQALDLLLGTWGGRRKPGLSGDRGRSVHWEPSGQPIAQAMGFPHPGPEEAPPMVLDNLHHLLANYQEALEVLQKDRPGTLNAVTLSSLLGGAALLLFVLLANLLQVSGGLRIWVPALVGASLCVGIGLVLAHPKLLHPGSPYTTAFSEYPPSVEAESSPASGQGQPRAATSANPPPGSGFSSRSDRQEGPSSSGQRGVPIRTEGKFSAAAHRCFGVPAMTLRQLLTIGAEEAHRLGWEEWPPKSKQTESKQTERNASGSPSSASQAKPSDLPPPSDKAADASSDARPSADRPSASLPKAQTPAEATSQANSSEEFSPLTGSRFVVREYVYRVSQNRTTTASEKGWPPAVLYWHPFFLIGPEGAAECRFDLPPLPGLFRIRADVQAAEGQMTLAEMKISSMPSEKKPSSEKSPSSDAPKTPPDQKHP